MPHTVLDSSAVGRAMARICYEIVERNNGAQNILLVGIVTRGFPFAQRLAAGIKAIENVDVPCTPLDVTNFRDDLATRTRSAHTGATIPRLGCPADHSSQQAPTSPLSWDPTSKTVIIVDDVLFTGRTARAAMDAVMQAGRASRIQLAVLVDRGHRELPLRPDYVGKNIPTSRHEQVAVHLREVDGHDDVEISTKSHDQNVTQR
ncbi:MAG: bifunctional pyr operon transcriptional regulator/uracil phosphoribosyltransferase PyrR [Actinomycetaceae bacterium]|nr:bifunctional pyr operon transcriptional regulator/uracil phosphoribosyltransferase PyrR [Actinomycetaceae bacterium]MDY6083587.1 bifunctional pyr operon transcriptional regulator/uracil phosphoribosyltransferase PyrR [Actinomycetaceae bacterium]